MTISPLWWANFEALQTLVLTVGRAYLISRRTENSYKSFFGRIGINRAAIPKDRECGQSLVPDRFGSLLFVLYGSPAPHEISYDQVQITAPCFDTEEFAESFLYWSAHGNYDEMKRIADAHSPKVVVEAERVAILQSDGEFKKIRIANDQECWMLSNLLK